MRTTRNCSRMLLTSTLLVSNFVVCCGGPSSKQSPAVADAMKALRKLAAAADVGTTYLQYGPLVVDAQALVNDASASLPESKLKTEMNAAMDAYVDAQQVWGYQIQATDGISTPRLWVDHGLGTTLIPKYSIQTQNGYADINRALRTIWLSAREHLDRASAELKGPN